MALYMLDTDTCSFIIRKHSPRIIDRLESAERSRARIVISAITYAEMRYGEIGSKAPARLAADICDFLDCLDEILPWNAEAVDRTIEIRKELARLGTPIGVNDAAIAGHAVTAGAILVTNNTREFSRVQGLRIDNWLV